MTTEIRASDGVSGEKGRRLESWKAIARYLQRDVRSVQRWERERGLPVHRMPGEKGTVFAYEHELERWRHSRENETDIVAEAPALPQAAPSRSRVPLAGGITAALLVLVAAAFLLLRGPVQKAPSHASLPPHTLAVLPMQNLSGDPAQDYFADGFTDELTTELAQLRSLRVISRTSTMLYRKSRKPLPEIARELNVRYILEGSVTRVADRVRVRAQLIDAATDTHISARDYNADVKDVLDIQSQIARAIAGDVSLDLSSAEKARLAAPRVVDPEAHDLYLQASYAYARQTPDSIREAGRLYQAAAARAPSFALAYVGIAQVEYSLGQITAQSQVETETREKQNLLKALAIEPDLGEARGLLASMTYSFDHNWPEAEREYRLALAAGAQAPTQARFGSALATRGRFAESMAHIQTALELDPLGMSPRVNQFIGLYLQRKYARAQQALEEALAINPDFLAGHALFGLDAMLQKDCARSASEAQWVEAHFPSPLAEFDAALADICKGNVAQARLHLSRMAAWKGTAFVSRYQLAMGYAAIGDKDAAISDIEKSIAVREPQTLYLKEEPVFDSLRSDPRFVALEKQLGLLD